MDAVVVIGCLVREQSVAFEFVAEAVTRACLKLGLKYKTPVIFGVLACTSAAQAKHCAGLHETSKTRSCSFGVEWAQSAIEMARLNRQAAQRTVDACACSCHSPTGHADDRQSESESDSETRRREGGFLLTKGATVTGTIPVAALPLPAGHRPQAATGTI
ncbi:hypothetical protein ATCC90586_011061 [Pythium insidiosum]|nr:hypothetical protein ATCC90586_011061 [Pythium insidiosum]